MIRQSFGRPRQAGRLIFSPLGRSLRLHWFAPLMMDQPEHEHPWWYLTIVLWGSYTEISAKKIELVRAPAIKFRRPPHKHKLMAGPQGSWSLVITGKMR